MRKILLYSRLSFCQVRVYLEELPQTSWILKVLYLWVFAWLFYAFYLIAIANVFNIHLF